MIISIRRETHNQYSLYIYNEDSPKLGLRLVHRAENPAEMYKKSMDKLENALVEVRKLYHLLPLEDR